MDIKCTNRDKCPMFQIFETEGAGKIMETIWCNTERHKKCARYIKNQNGEPVPNNLLPNGSILTIG